MVYIAIQVQKSNIGAGSWSDLYTSGIQPDIENLGQSTAYIHKYALVVYTSFQKQKCAGENPNNAASPLLNINYNPSYLI